MKQDPLRWLKVASLLPGKNHEDVRYRYQRLVYDVHKIENAMPVSIKGGFLLPKGCWSLPSCVILDYSVWCFVLWWCVCSLADDSSGGLKGS